MKQHTTALFAIIVLAATVIPMSGVAEARGYARVATDAGQARFGDVVAITQLTEPRSPSLRVPIEWEERSWSHREPAEDTSDEVEEPTEENETEAEPEERAPAPEDDPETEERGSGADEETEAAPEGDEPEPAVEEPEEDPEPQTDSNASSYLEAVVLEIHRLTNRERQAAGVEPLSFDNTLASIAEGHSEDMANRDYFSHTSPEGCSVSCRFEEAGYEASAWGENIAWRRSSSLPNADALAAHFVESWMNSDGHRHNLLSENFTHEGVGVAQVGDTVYATVNFALPR